MIFESAFKNIPKIIHHISFLFVLLYVVVGILLQLVVKLGQWMQLVNHISPTGNSSSPRSWYPFVHNHDSRNNVLHRCIVTILSRCHSFSSNLLSFPFSSPYPYHPDRFKSLVFFFIHPFDTFYFILHFRISVLEQVMILS